MSVYGRLYGNYGYCVVVVLLKKVKRTIVRERELDGKQAGLSGEL